MAIGVVSRFPDHLQHFAPAYYEVKGVNGVWHRPVPGAISMISIFGDNRVAREHPDWVQEGPDGMRAVRESPYFDWDALCPSQDRMFDLGLQWVRRAAEEGGGLPVRLDDVTYAREEFCRCRACAAQQERRGLTFDAYRIARIAEFVREAHRIAPRLEMTLYPDPYPGHLERRFGLDPDQLAPYIETFVVPIYDMHYATTYWVEVLAQAFRERLRHRFFIELYGLEVPETALTHAAMVAQAYADGVVIAYDNQLEKLLRIRRRLLGE